MKNSKLILSLFLTVCFAIVGISWAAEMQAPVGFGKNYDEIVALAKKEGKVRLAASNPDEKQAKKFFQPFVKKYGITVDYSRARGTESRERILLELMAGMAEYDLLHISQELIPKYKQANTVAGPFDWSALFGIAPIFIDPENYMVAAGASVWVIAYNPDLVPKDHIPRKWEDFLDPWWQGKFVVDIRPRTFGALHSAWGSKKLLDFCRALAANKPVWKRGQTAVSSEVAAGEYPAFCGVQINSVLRILDRDPGAKIHISIPEEVPADLFATFGVLKAAKNPNAALLLAGWLASFEGQKRYAVVHREHPILEGTKIAEMIKASQAKLTLNGWEYTLQEGKISTSIVEAWNFPSARKKKKK